MRSALLSLCFVLASVNVFSQSYFEPKLSFTVDLGIPAKGGNSAFRHTMEGLFNGGFGLQYNIVGGLTAGLGFKYSFFTLSPFALNNVSWGGSMHYPAAYFKLGYERFTTNRVSFNFSVRAGYAAVFSTHSNDTCTAVVEPENFEMSFFVEPQFEVVLLTDKVSADGFSMVLGYPIYMNEFGPRYFCLDKFFGLQESDNQGYTRFFSFGFGYRFYFGRN